MIIRPLVQVTFLSALALHLVACIGPFKKKDADEDEISGDDDDDDDDDDAPANGNWKETDWCGDMADLSDVADAYDPSKLRQTLVEVSELRYPPAVAFIDAQSDSNLNAWFMGSDGNFGQVMDRYEVAVHEGAHIWGFDHFSFSSYSYRIVDDDHIIETAYLDNFYRSEILDRHPDPGSDFYSDTYLTGGSGAQGFNTLLDEYNAYTHSLASRHCIRDQFGGGSTSARDGILTFMWYVETYLKIAREDHPDDYDDIVADNATVDVILDIWDRAEFWLEVTDGDDSLGIDDDEIAELTYDPDNLEEINRLR